MLYAIIGGIGSGKTLAQTYILWKKHRKGCNIFSNYHLAFNHSYISCLDQIEQIRNGYAGLDELWSWIDSRDWKVPKRKKVNRIILYSRKRGVEIIYTTQRFGQIEKRIRDNTEIIIEPLLDKFVPQKTALALAKRLKLDCSKFKFTGNLKVPLRCTLEYRNVTNTSISGSTNYSLGKVFKRQKFFTLPIMCLYDTTEEIKLEE